MNGLILQVQTSLFHFMQTVQASLLYLHHQDLGIIISDLPMTRLSLYFPTHSITPLPWHHPTVSNTHLLATMNLSCHHTLCNSCLFVLPSDFLQFLPAFVVVLLSSVHLCLYCHVSSVHIYLRCYLTFQCTSTSTCVATNRMQSTARATWNKVLMQWVPQPLP